MDDDTNGTDDTSPSRDYEVGYGKPPKDTQFKKGHKSRGGRKKGTKNHRTLVQEHLMETLPMKTAHGTVHITCREAILKRALTDAALGKSPRAVELGLRLIEQYGPSEGEGAWDLTKLTDEELDILESILAKMAAE